MHAMPVLVTVLCLMAIAYRYYSAFLAAKVASLDDARVTPAIARADGQNYYATNRWVLFGHHFAAISGSGPLIGPVLAAQFGYLPGLLWIVIGVCLAGAVQDFLALSMSIRRGGRSLARIAGEDIGPVAGTAATIAILFILIIALAGLGKVVVGALAGDALTKGSSWGVFTIGATIPIALFIGLYMYKIRPGKVIEASLIGGALTLGATFAGGWVSHQGWAHVLELSDAKVTIAMAVYGFVASVLPVWILLTPRDYLSSFLKIGTIALLVIGTILANPNFQAPAINHIFIARGPTVDWPIFPFLFITIMCGAISGFHALVSTGTTSKMISRETDARMIGFGAMLIEGLVAVIAIIAATTLSPGDYFAMNTRLADVQKYQTQVSQVRLIAGSEDHIGLYEQRTEESLHGRTGGAVTLAVGMASIFDGAANRVWSGGSRFIEGMWKYWYHFAIMFEALFILTTIDAGTRIGRFLLQEIAGKVNPRLGRPGSWPGTIVSAALIVAAWAYFIHSNSMQTIWPMFGVANQMLAVIALSVITAYLVNEGRLRYTAVTILPLLFVAATTTTASAEMLSRHIQSIHTVLHLKGFHAWRDLLNPAEQAFLIAAMLICGTVVFGGAAVRVYTALAGADPEPIPAAAVPDA